MKLLALFLAVLLLGLGVWWMADQEMTWWSSLQTYVENGEILTLEARFNPEQIMEVHQKDLLNGEGKTFQGAELKFYPYLMMDVKYTQPNKRTKESVILWSLVDGEMVLDTNTWEQTHGFEDAINANANRHDFRILNALASKNGTMTREQLQKELGLDGDNINPFLDSAQLKHLITFKGNEVQLHFQDPNFYVQPQTKVNQWLVTKTYQQAQRMPRRYSPGQIEKIAKAAFGNDFTIRSSKEVFLPVFSIQILNPDGSLLTTYWNAVNGKRINPHYSR